MKLSDYLHSKNLEVREFALLSKLSASAIYKVIQKKSASKETIKKIVDSTDGEVTANDIFDINNSEIKIAQTQ